jgi:hypothetical protein
MRVVKYFQIGLVKCILCAVPLGSLHAQEASKGQSPAAANAAVTPDSYDQEKMRKYFAEAARQYKIKTDKGEELKLREKPLMHTENPQAISTVSGTIFLWETKDGRPAVIHTVFCYWRVDRMRCRHELISLLPEGLEADFESEIVWQPEGDSIKFTKLADVQAPAANAARRLVQMRQIAKEFTGELEVLDQPTTKLTLLPTPVLRYEAAADRIVDGAIFSFAVSTNAEILLTLEAREEGDGTMNWYWSAARAHYQELNLSYKGTRVWSAQREMGLQKNGPGEMPYARQDYFTFSPRVEMPLPDQLK